MKGLPGAFVAGNHRTRPIGELGYQRQDLGFCQHLCTHLNNQLIGLKLIQQVTPGAVSNPGSALQEPIDRWLGSWHKGYLANSSFLSQSRHCWSKVA